MFYACSPALFNFCAPSRFPLLYSTGNGNMEMNKQRYAYNGMEERAKASRRFGKEIL